MSEPVLTSGDWPSASLTTVQRLEVLAAALPHAVMVETTIAVGYDGAWAWMSDLPSSVPRFDGQVRSLSIRSRDGARLRIRSRVGPGAVVPVPFDVVLEDGWCLMSAPARLYVVGMAAERVDDDRTRIAVMESVPRRWSGALATGFLRRHVPGDVRRLAALISAEAPTT